MIPKSTPAIHGGIILGSSNIVLGVVIDPFRISDVAEVRDLTLNGCGMVSENFVNNVDLKNPFSQYKQT
jgi:hypothetical protein